jgi:ribonucleoside-diphosphate reductase alpha chain
MPEGITIEEAYKTCETITKDRLAAKILVDKYFLQDPETKLYTEHKPEHLWDRLAKAISQAEIKQLKKEFELKFRDLLEDFKFVPGGRILYGLGNPYANITLKNCYVIDIQEDSIKGIFDTAYKMAETYKAGGGCGIDISRLRPKGLPVHNAARTSSGSVSFMQFFSTVTGMIGQNGRIGALLISIDVDHPDIMDFIKIKGGDDLDLVRYANVSVKITDEFMRAVEDDREYDLKWNGQVFDTVPARKVWNEIIHRAWKRGEPGMLFWDTVKRTVPAHHYGGFGCVTTNPCGET